MTGPRTGGGRGGGAMGQWAGRFEVSAPRIAREQLYSIVTRLLDPQTQNLMQVYYYCLRPHLLRPRSRRLGSKMPSPRSESGSGCRIYRVWA